MPRPSVARQRRSRAGSLSERIKRPQSAAWTSLLPSLRQWYLHENWTTEEICKHILTENLLGTQVTLTSRMLKSRFRQYGLDDKKIEGELYYCMFRYLQLYPDEDGFVVPIRNGRMMKERYASEVKKETKRNGKQKPELMAEWKVKYSTPESVMSALKDKGVETMSTRAALNRSQVRASDTDFESGQDDGNDIISITSESEIHTPTDGQEDFRLTRDSNRSGPTSTLSPLAVHSRTSNMPRAGRLLTQPNTFHNSMLNNVVPARQLAGFIGQPQVEVMSAKNEVRTAADQLTACMEDLDLELAKSPQVQRYTDEEQIGERIARIYAADTTSFKSDVMRFAHYWLYLCLNNASTPDDFHYADRQSSRNLFTKMLDEENNLALLVYRFVTGVFISHDRHLLLAAFFLDCYVASERSSSIYSKTARTAFRYSFRTCGEELGSHAQILRSAGLSLPAGFYDDLVYEREFQDAIQELERRDRRHSHEHLYLRQDYAWLVLKLGRPLDALSILLETQKNAEDVLGTHNATTISCLELVGLCYKRNGNAAMARSNYGFALNRLRYSDKVNEAQYFHIMLKLGELELQEEQYDQAVGYLWQVLQYQSIEFEANRSILWTTVGYLRNTLPKCQHPLSRDIEQEIERLDGKRHALWITLGKPCDKDFYC